MSDKKFPKKYSPEYESKIYNYWLEKGYFNPEKLEEIKGKLKDRFVISMPPPNVTGVLHLGHALMLSIEDAMTRYARMQGKKTLWIPGTDHAGIATQVVVERKLKEEKKLSRYDLGRERFLNEVWNWVKYSRNTIISQIKKMGASCDWSREQFTLSEKLSRAVRKSFVNLYKKGKIYRSNYIVNWCPRCQTVLSDIEVKYKEEKGKLYYIRYFIKGKGDYITVATTRPETMFADVAVAVNPKDRRYKKWIGKDVILPIVNVSIPIIADEHVDPAFGTGALKITPTHDPDDFEIAQRHNLPMDKFAIDKNGKYTDIAGKDFKGRDVYEDFDRLITYLEEIGNLEKIEDHIHKVPYCDRCGTRIQPMVSLQWFVDVSEAAKNSIEAVKKEIVKIHPDRFNKIYFDWLDNIRPWCISRQLWWGHRIPVWHCEKGHINVFDEDIIYERFLSKEKNKNLILSLIIFNLIADSRLKNPFSLENLIDILFSDSLTPQEGKVLNVYLKIYENKFKNNKVLLKEIEKLNDILFAFEKDKNLPRAGEEIIEILENAALITKQGDEYKFNFKCLECNDIKLKQDEDVLDTWFSSALWPFSILGWPDNTKDLQNYYPNDIMETGYDILFFRVARMMMMGYENMKDFSIKNDLGEFKWIPFKNIYLHGLVRDEKGEKMSKSKGNVIDPLEIIEKYGADSLRLALLMGNTPGNDLKFSMEKVDYAYRFLNKLWNASRFVYMKFFNSFEVENSNIDIKINYDFLKQDIQENLNKFNDFDNWILYKLNFLIHQVNDYMDKFMLGEAILNIVKFAWNDYCDWYIEISKNEKSEYTEKILLYVLSTILKLLHSFAPFVTEELWKLLHFEGDLIIQNLPDVLENVNYNTKVDIFMDVISELRNLKNKAGLKPHDKVDVVISSNSSFIQLVRIYKELIVKLLNAENIEFLINKEIPDEYNISVVFDTKVGLKGQRKLSLKEQLQLLEKDLEKEEQFANSLRSMLINEEFLSKAPEKIIEQKRKKLKEVEDRILEIQLEIRKIKSKIK